MKVGNRLVASILTGVVGTLLVLWLETGEVGFAKEKSPFSVEILPSQNAIQAGIPMWKAGAPIFLIVKMTNHSQRVLHFAFTNPAFNYRVRVLDTSGQQVPETENLRKMREGLRNGLDAGRNILIEVKPGGTCQDGIEVSFLYDVSKPGEYFVQVERDMPPELGKGVTTSNKIRATVTE